MAASGSHVACFISFLFTIFLTFNIAKAQSNVTRGSSLRPTGATTSWLSPSGLYAFGFYPQTGGYAVGIYIAGTAERTVVWTASRDILPLSDKATLRFTTDGRLVVDQRQGLQISISGIGGASVASMHDSGNFVLYDSDRRTVLWQSFDNPTDTFLAGQRLVPGQALLSSVSEADHSIGIFKLSMQIDGNLVQYPNLGFQDRAVNAYWSSGTAETGPNVTLNLDSDGFLYLLQNSTFYIRNLTRRGQPRENAIYRMKIDVDGIFRLYYHNLSVMSQNESVVWSSSPNKCTGLGLCGLNGYCQVLNDATRCTCLPGFDFVNPSLWSLGCQRNYTAETCKIDDDQDTSMRMARVLNARWEDGSYAVPKALTEEACSLACLNDCNCEGALFTGRGCWLQKLPLRFIEVIEDESDVGLIKVYTSSVNNGSDPSNPLIQVKKERQVTFLVVGVSLISFAALILLLSGVIMWRSKVWAYRKISEHVNVKLFEDVGPRAFSYAELERTTDGFKEELGRGSFGIVYKGIIQSSMKMVAVKKLKKELAQEGEKEFQTEMKVIGRTHHRNLTRLLGYCSDGPERLLVFEYMTRGSLADILFDSNRKPFKVDVYSFGVVLFEILCCRKKLDNSLPSNEVILEDWVYECYETDQLLKLVNDEDVDRRTLDRMIKIGLWCIQEEPSLRPSMKTVMLMLEGTVKIPVPPDPTSFLSVV
ncbi:hypothetical protein L2E82_08137 [Cichorium intybus]|uniref:Uncharacterized protein n=1 Tax=Cichorium intybus TaxID=13427 RepID=A0ACB9G5F9_CICIN|nr:hypothetical protein L2E82_08137 [Cichorium intybus]